MEPFDSLLVLGDDFEYGSVPLVPADSAGGGGYQLAVVAADGDAGSVNFFEESNFFGGLDVAHSGELFLKLFSDPIAVVVLKMVEELLKASDGNVAIFSQGEASCHAQLRVTEVKTRMQVSHHSEPGALIIDSGDVLLMERLILLKKIHECVPFKKRGYGVRFLVGDHIPPQIYNYSSTIL